MQPQNNYVTASHTNAIKIPPLGTVRVGYFWSLDTLVRNLGGNPFDILEEKGLDPRLFDELAKNANAPGREYGGID